MILTISFMFAALIIIVAIYSTNRTGEKPNGNILLGVALPRHVLKNSAVINIISKYREAHSLLALIFLILTSPILFFSGYASAILLYLAVWIIVYIWLNQKLVGKYFMRLYSLKKENEWWMGTQRIISVDTEVSRLKGTFPVSKKWFIPPLIITVASIMIILFSDNREMLFWPIAINGLILLFLFFMIYFIYSKSRTVVYSDSTEVNTELNRVFKREWTKCCVIIAFLQSCYFLALTFLLAADNTKNAEIIITAISFTYCIILIPVTFCAHNRIRGVRNRMRGLVNKEVYEDDDLCWAFGVMIYNNPKDSRTFVEKRMGHGMTMNIASAGGKAFAVIIVLAFAVLMGFAVYNALLELGLVFHFI
ncbi:MAG: DUF5808 domain-containing protein [Defluviitaleaceae bacterium]|nr:DUF5808 domain-containing protein [Defluviitaleaceae bacterium]MCL2836524.1 DUF5808 domain-containing protein [Defluviitaleaceae bacterium]